MINVVLVEDEPMWQQGIAALLSMDAELVLVGTVDNADEAESMVERLKPDIVLLDWKILGGRDGLELAKSLERMVTPQQIILVTGSPVDQIPEHPYGYVPKPRIATELIDQIKSRAKASCQSC